MFVPLTNSAKGLEVVSDPKAYGRYFLSFEAGLFDFLISFETNPILFLYSLGNFTFLEIKSPQNFDFLVNNHF